MGRCRGRRCRRRRPRRSDSAGSQDPTTAPARRSPRPRERKSGATLRDRWRRRCRGSVRRGPRPRRAAPRRSAHTSGRSPGAASARRTPPRRRRPPRFPRSRRASSVRDEQQLERRPKPGRCAGIRHRGAVYPTGLLHYPAPRSRRLSMKRLMLAALLVSVAAAAPAAAHTTTLTMSSWVSPQHHLTSVVLQGWATEVEKATNGRVKFTMLPNHPSAPPGTFDAVRDGLVDLSFVTASYTPARHILPLLAELPGSGDTALVNSVAYSRVYWKHFHKVGEYKGVKLLGVFTHGPGQMFTKKPVKSIADVQGLKIRTGGGIAEQVAKALGASAFVKPAPESYELLSSGVADGVFFPLESIISFKLDTVLEQATLFPGGMYSSSFGFFMNEDKCNKLPRQDQEAIAKISGEHIARLAG